MKERKKMPRKETAYYRVVGRSENQGGQYFLVGIICPPVESVLTDLSKSGGAMASPPGTLQDDRPVRPLWSKNQLPWLLKAAVELPLL